MAPLPDDWKILEDGEAVPFEENEATRRARQQRRTTTVEPTTTPTKDIPASDGEESRKAVDWSNHEFRNRVLSSVILAPLVLGAVVAGGMVFYGVIIVAAVLMMREWDALHEHRMSSAWGWAGVVYVAGTCLSVLILREQSLTLVIYLLAVIWATDIGAYFAGRQIGGLKLAPRISPKKTWAGLLGGVLSAVTVGGILSFFFAFPANVVQAALLGAVLAVIAQLGDLFESWMKREAGMKDSSNLIPGHGGILDRVDGLTFTAPLLVILHHWLTTADAVVHQVPAPL